MNPALLLIGGAGGAILLSSLFKSKEGQETGDPIPDNLINPPAVEQAPSEPVPEALTIQQRIGPLVVILNIHVNWFEKAASRESTILKGARAAALKIAALVAANCPGAPKLQGSPAVKLKDVSGGYEVTIVWSALWGTASKGNIRSVVQNCIIAQMKASSDQFKDRFVSMQAYRA